MTKKSFQVGTLLEDTGKLGVIYRIVEAGSLNTLVPIIDWGVNYEIYYVDGTITMMGEATLKRWIEAGKVCVLEEKIDMPPEVSGAVNVV